MTTVKNISSADLDAFRTELVTKIQETESQLTVYRVQLKAADDFASVLAGDIPTTRTARSNGTSPRPARPATSSGKNGAGPEREILQRHGVKVSQRGRLSAEHKAQAAAFLAQENEAQQRSLENEANSIRLAEQAEQAEAAALANLKKPGDTTPAPADDQDAAPLELTPSAPAKTPKAPKTPAATTARRPRRSTGTPKAPLARAS